MTKMVDLVIRIPEETYKSIIKSDIEVEFYRSADVFYSPISIMCAIRTGKVLPKGHGALVDKSKIYKAIYAEEDNCTGMGMTLDEMDAYNDGIDAMYSLVENAPTIIEADKVCTYKETGCGSCRWQIECPYDEADKKGEEE